MPLPYPYQIHADAIALAIWERTTGNVYQDGMTESAWHDAALARVAS